MRLIEYTEVAWAALAGNPMRSALTTLGIVIGVAAVVGVSLILNGMTAAMSQSFEGLGPRALFIMPYQGPESRNQRVELTYEDALAVQAECPAVEFTAPQLTLNTTVTAEGHSRPVALIATIPPYQDFNNSYVEEGRFFNTVDLRHRRNVCVVGGTVADEIGRRGLIGRSLRIDRHYFEVIGVMERQGQMMGTDRDDVTLIPLSTAGKLYGTMLPRRLTVMTQARSPELIDAAIQQITTVLRKRHRLGDRPADFKVYTQTEILSSFRQFSMLVTAVVAGIVSIALFVGGIGIMNTMLASVTERAYEIGLRKAVGARRAEILAQFLIEAVTLSAGGGVLGLGAGCGLGLGFGWMIHLPMSVTVWPLALAFGFAAGVGLFFGVYPAVRAADLDPITALQRV